MDSTDYKRYLAIATLTERFMSEFPQLNLKIEGGDFVSPATRTHFFIWATHQAPPHSEVPDYVPPAHPPSVLLPTDKNDGYPPGFAWQAALSDVVLRTAFIRSHPERNLGTAGPFQDWTDQATKDAFYQFTTTWVRPN